MTLKPVHMIHVTGITNTYSIVALRMSMLILQSITRRIMTLKLPNIDFEFWASKNIYSSDDLDPKVARALKIVERAGLVKKNEIRSNKYLFDLIIDKIQSNIDSNDYSDDDLMTIFDLIQAWGGPNGRAPYVIPDKTLGGKCNRPHSLKYPQIYREFVQNIYGLNKTNTTDRKIDELNKILCSMRQVQIAFSTKHMYFWSLALKDYHDCRLMCIYDKRMVNLMESANNLL